MMSSRYKRWRTMLSLLSRPVDCQGWLHGEIDALRLPRTRLVRPAKESVCCGSHAKRAVTRSDGKVEKDTVTLSLEGSRRHRGACLGVRSVVATETLSATVKLVSETEEPALDPVGYGMVSRTVCFLELGAFAQTVSALP